MSRPRPARKEPSESSRSEVLLEKLLGEFKTFGEGLAGVRQKLDNIFDQVGRNTEAIDRLSDRILALEGRFAELEKRVTAVETD